MKKGTYILSIQVAQNKKIKIGAIGEIKFDSGIYKYIGSAFGPGGFKRIERHKDVSQGKNENIRWHIDYLNSDSDSKIIEVEKFPEQKIECQLAQKIAGEPIKKFGCSDCKCKSHLFYQKK